jgi:hypothetical protein
VPRSSLSPFGMAREPTPLSSSTLRSSTNWRGVTACVEPGVQQRSPLSSAYITTHKQKKKSKSDRFTHQCRCPSPVGSRGGMLRAFQNTSSRQRRTRAAAGAFRSLYCSPGPHDASLALRYATRLSAVAVLAHSLRWGGLGGSP